MGCEQKKSGSGVVAERKWRKTTISQKITDPV